MSETRHVTLPQPRHSWGLSLTDSFLDAVEYLTKHNLFPQRRMKLPPEKIQAINLKLARQEYPHGTSMSGDEFFNRSIMEVERLADEKRLEATRVRAPSYNSAS